jgi:hypothetical protein
MRYAVTPLTSILLTADRTTADFDTHSERNAVDVRFMPSVEFSPLAAISGRAAFGVQRRRFDTPGQGRDTFTGTVATVDLNSTILERTRLGVTVRRQLQYSYLEEVADYLESGFDFNLYQNVGNAWEVGGNVGRYRLNYREASVSAAATAPPIVVDTAPGGIVIAAPADAAAAAATRELPDETVLSSGAELRYRFGRARLGLRVDVRTRTSDEPAISRGYNRYRVGRSFSYGF